MSWDAVISRMSDADFDENKSAIPLSEWRALASSDPSLLLVRDEPPRSRRSVADRVGDENDRIVEYVWIGDPPLRSAKDAWILNWTGEDVSVKSPDTATLRKLFHLAERLQANVRDGDSTLIPKDYDPDASTAAYWRERREAEARGPTVGARGEPAVPIQESVTDDHLICLEDGKRLVMLRAYLWKTYNMTPEQYRARWGLPNDYPMVAPSYLRRRAHLIQGG